MPSEPPTMLLPSAAKRQRIDAVDVVEHEAAEQPVAHQRAEDRDVDVGGHREDAPRLLDAAQVGEADAHDEDQPERTRCLARSWNVGIDTIAATPAEIDTATVRM